jgi:thioredoxin-like negative regulator of GroEL
MSTPNPDFLCVACLCAAWCRLCDGYAAVFDPVIAQLQALHPSLQACWIDIEDEAELVGDLDVETFPTVVVVDAGTVRFAGPLTPQPETLRRILRAAVEASLERRASGYAAPEVEAFAQRLRERPR